jgi:hypothetical protein
MNVEIGAEAALFPEKEYINGISLQCNTEYILYKLTRENVHSSTVRRNFFAWLAGLVLNNDNPPLVMEMQKAAAVITLPTISLCCSTNVLVGLVSSTSTNEIVMLACTSPNRQVND